MRRADLDDMLADLRDAAAIKPIQPEQFYKAYRRVQAAAFYLSPDQIEEVNVLRDDHWKRRMAHGAKVRAIGPPLSPRSRDGGRVPDRLNLRGGGQDRRECPAAPGIDPPEGVFTARIS